MYLHNIKGTIYVYQACNLNCATMDNNKQNECMQRGGVWSLYISIDCDNTLAGSGKLPTAFLSKVTNYMKA